MSKNTAIGFIVGATVGSVVTWFVSKQEYEKRMNEEIRSLRKIPEEEPKENDIPTNDVETEENDKEVDMMEYARRVKEHGYTQYDTVKPSDKEEGDVIEEGPYTIDPKEFGMTDDYTEISLSLYADGVLADEDDNIVEDVEGTVGRESLNTFGEYEDDAVYVRNDARRCDYEILLDKRRYRDIKRPKI